jgi:hypothetical protein
VPERTSTQQDRSAIGRIGAYESWGRTANRTARTAPARAALERKFYDAVPPEITNPEARAKAAEDLRRAHYLRLARKSVESRRSGRTDAQRRAAAAELRAAADELDGGAA